jgi:hypothetical protein
MCDSESGEEGSEESSTREEEGSSLSGEESSGKEVEGSFRSGEESSGNEEEGSSRSGKESSTRSDSQSSRTSEEVSSVEVVPVRKITQRRKPLNPIVEQNEKDEASGEDAKIANPKKDQGTLTPNSFSQLTDTDEEIDIQAKDAGSEESSGDQRSVSSNDSANGYQPGKDATPDLSSLDEKPSVPQTRKRKGAASKKVIHIPLSHTFFLHSLTPHSPPS